MYVCLCNAITDGQVQDAINEGACSVDCLRSRLGLASQCGKCATYAETMLSAATVAGQPANRDPMPGAVAKLSGR